MNLVGNAGAAPKEGRWLKVLAVAVAVAFLLLIGRLWQLQVMQGDRHYHHSTNNFIKKVELPATRGRILDHTGKVLVDNRPSYNVYVIPRFLTDESLARLGRHLKLTEEQLANVKTKAQAKKGLDRFQQILAFEDVSRDEMGALESNKEDLPGVSVTAVAHRHYPHGKIAAHLLGYMNQISGPELAAKRDEQRGAQQAEPDYRSGDYIGRAGVEAMEEGYLKGHDGWEKRVVDAKGHEKTDLDRLELEALIGGKQRLAPTPGDNVVLTIDLELQQIVEKTISRHRSAAAVVIDVESGKVLALASHPAFDPNVLTGHLTRVEDERLQKDPYKPLIDKAVREHYFPASTWKIIPALAALEDKTIGEHDKQVCHGAYVLPGHTFHCMKSHGKVNLYDAVVQSCNLYFYHLGESVGMDRMARMAHDFGFGSPTGIRLSNEASGFVPTQDFHKRHGGFRIGYTLNTAIGQGATKVTLLQMALAYAALANGGNLWTPELVERIETPSGNVVQAFSPRLRHKVEVAPQHLETMRRALCGVVNDVKGTAHSARDPNMSVEVCGKSGTAQLRKNRRGVDQTSWDAANDHAWFAAFAPAKKPKVAAVILVEHGGLGGHVAAPTGVAILRKYFEREEKLAALRKATEAGPASPAPPAPPSPPVQGRRPGAPR